MFDLEKIKGTALEEAVRQMPAAAFIAEAPSGKLILVNEQARRMIEQNLGWPMPQDLGELGDFGDLKVFHPDGRPLEMEEWPLVRSIGSGEEVRDEEYAYPLVDGTRLWLRCGSSPIYDDEGRLVAGVLIVHDTTEQKRAEEQLAYHARLLENVQEAVIALDEQFDVTAWNRGAEEMYGRRADEALGRNVWEVVPIELSEEQRAKIHREVVEKGRRRTELIAYRKDGTPIHSEVIIAALRGEQGEVTGYLSIYRDITERKRFETDQQRLVDIVQNSSDFIGIADLDWRAIYLNDAGQKLVGLNEIQEVRRTGVLGTHPKSRRTFSEDDANFLQAVANVLATAVERKKAEEKLRGCADRLVANVSMGDEEPI